jgi:hypothetical protein
MKLVASVSLLDLGTSEARYTIYQLTDFLEPGLYSENDKPQLVKILTLLKVTRTYTSVLQLRFSVLSEMNVLSQNPLRRNLRLILISNFHLHLVFQSVSTKFCFCRKFHPFSLP